MRMRGLEILNGYDTKSFEKMDTLCKAYNDAVDKQIRDQVRK